MPIPKAIILALGSLWFASASVHAEVTANSSAGQFFKFKFELNKPLIYAVEFKTRSVTDARAGERSSLTRNSQDFRYKIRLTAVRANPDSTTTVYYEPFDFEEDIQSVGPGGQMDTSIRGLEIFGKQNGIVMVDTAKGIGMSQAQNLKPPVYPHLLSGYFDFDPTGHIQRINGDLPFIDTWQNNLKYNMNLFYIVFPTNSIAVHDSWTNYLTLKTGGGVVFNGDGFVQPWVFNRELDQAMTNAQVACFSLYESDIYKDVGGYLDQLGQQTSVAIPEHVESMNATFQFDQKLGRLIGMKKSDRLHNDISMMVQGNPTESHGETEADISVTLISP